MRPGMVSFSKQQTGSMLGSVPKPLHDRCCAFSSTWDFYTAIYLLAIDRSVTLFSVLRAGEAVETDVEFM
jgi:hypothetical protein